jgi:hypothetical protein
LGPNVLNLDFGTVFLSCGTLTPSRVEENRAAASASPPQQGLVDENISFTANFVSRIGSDP